MSKQIQPTKIELFTEVSEHEQETAVGGLSVSFFQTDTNIISLATSQSNVSKGDLSMSSSQNALYMFSQKTTGVVFDFGNYYDTPGQKVPALVLLRRMINYYLFS
jgi:hypothetical protein